MSTAYCVRCKKTSELKDAHVKAAGKRTMQCGNCTTCGGKCCKFMGKTPAAHDHAEEVKEKAASVALPKVKRSRGPRISKHLCPVCLK
jgi:Fe-S-cluster containining protein